MTKNRGAEIERFYWLIINLLGKVFGFLLLIAGGLFLLGMIIELVRTGSMAWDGSLLTEWSQQWPVLLGGVVVTLVGLVLVKVLPVDRKDQANQVE